jgi:PEGA domain
MIRSRSVVALLGFGLVVLVGASGLGGTTALAQQVRPPVKGRSHRVKIDSSPQQAAVYWSAGSGAIAGQPKDYGIAGYTPITLKVPRGAVTFVVELQGWKPQQKAMDVKKSQTVMFTLERAPAVAKLDLQSTSDGTGTGADVTIDGVSRGTIPNAFEVTAGRHQVEVKKAGFQAWSQWFDLAEGEHHTHDVSLARVEAPAGALLVTSDAGGDVYVDGVRKDVAPAIITGVPAGDHVIEVRKDGVPPWRQNVTVPSGQQVKVAAVFGAAAAGNGSLRVLASETDAEIFVDGDDKGHSPANIASIAPGDHVVEARKPKWKTTQQTVRVVAGQSALAQLKLELAPPDRPHAGLKVQSTVPNAEVFVDGSSLGRAPIDRSDLDPGKHYVSVHKDGFTDFKREVVLIENQAVALVADLSASGSVRIISAPEAADVRIDGEYVGKTPLSRDTVGAGDHVLEIDLKGYFKYKETVKIEGGREKVFSVDLKFVPTGPTPEQVAKRKQGMSSFGAKVNPVGGVTVDFAGGYPYFLTVRATVGAFNVKPLGLDIGVEFQTFFEMFDFSGHARLQLVEAGPLSLAARANAGYGFGPDGRNSWFADIMPVASLAFSSVATVSASARWNLWTDRFCPSQPEVAAGVGQSDYCTDTSKAVNVFGTNPDRTRRFSGQRLLIGFAAAASIDRLTSVFVQMEFVPGLAPTARPMFTDAINSAMADHDTFVYGMIGLSLKF